MENFPDPYPVIPSQMSISDEGYSRNVIDVEHI
jgi:hypothetical protein